MGNITYGRVLMGSSLAVHILYAITGIALPLLVSVAELLGIPRRDSAYILMARRCSTYSSCMSGTNLSPYSRRKPRPRWRRTSAERELAHSAG